MVQLGDKLAESRKGAERNRVNMFNANKRIQEFQSDVEQLRSTVMKVESNSEAQSARLSDKVANSSSALTTLGWKENQTQVA